MHARRAVAMTAIAVASVAFAACSGEKAPAAGSTPQTAAMPGEPAAEMARLLNEFDPAALRNLVTENARLLAPNVPAIEGREAIVEYYDGIVDEMIRYEAVPLRSLMVGDVGVTEGEYRVKNLNTGANVEAGKYMAVWVNQAGDWKIARLMTNTDAQVPRTSIEIGPEATSPPE